LVSETAFNRTEAALDRLGTVIDRLESAAARVGAGDLLLAGELRDARDQQAALADSNRVVSARLDQAIFRLRTLLEE
jgi:hypothetical protein